MLEIQPHGKRKVSQRAFPDSVEPDLDQIALMLYFLLSRRPHINDGPSSLGIDPDLGKLIKQHK